jgi:hypothetical protein
MFTGFQELSNKNARCVNAKLFKFSVAWEKGKKRFALTEMLM